MNTGAKNLPRWCVQSCIILRQQTCTLLLPISLTISISCTLFQELYNRFLSVFTLQLENPRNANEIFAIASQPRTPELWWWHICWGRLIDIDFWKSQCDGQTQTTPFFCQVENVVVNRKAEEANKYQVDRWQICKTCELNGLSTRSEKVLREDNCNKTQAFHCDTRTLLYLQCPLNIGTANKNVFVVYNLSNFLT